MPLADSNWWHAHNQIGEEWFIYIDAITFDFNERNASTNIFLPAGINKQQKHMIHVMKVHILSDTSKQPVLKQMEAFPCGMQM